MPSLEFAQSQQDYNCLTGPPPPEGRLRVLHIQSGREYGGIQRMLLCLAECREQCPSIEPVFALCYQEQLAGELAKCGAEIRDLGPARLREPWGVWRANRRLRNLLASESFDAVICHGSPLLAGFGLTVRRAGVPLVYWMHNDVKTRNKNIFEFLAGRERPDLVIANSGFTAASLPLQFLRVPPHVVIPCPVTRPQRRDLTAGDRTAIRAKLKTPENAVVIILVARLEAWKGHGLLLEALARLRDLPNWRCWIVGGTFDARQEAFLKTLQTNAQASGIADQVHFLGQRQDVPELLQAADLFCQPNLTPEPFGIAFIEALYAGIPVVSVSHGGAMEIVDESCGRLVKPNDPAGLAAMLEKLIRDGATRTALSRNAPNRGAAISDPAKVLAAVHEQLSILKRTAAEASPAAGGGRS